jgi:hypothetical protein
MSELHLKTWDDGKAIKPSSIDYIVRGKIVGLKGTTVVLKTGEEVFLENSEEEILRAMKPSPSAGSKNCGRRRAQE